MKSNGSKSFVDDATSTFNGREFKKGMPKCNLKFVKVKNLRNTLLATEDVYRQGYKFQAVVQRAELAKYLPTLQFKHTATLEYPINNYGDVLVMLLDSVVSSNVKLSDDTGYVTPTSPSKASHSQTKRAQLLQNPYAALRYDLNAPKMAPKVAKVAHSRPSPSKNSLACTPPTAATGEDADEAEADEPMSDSLSLLASLIALTNEDSGADVVVDRNPPKLNWADVFD